MNANSEEIKVPIVFEESQGSLQYATHATIQHTEDEFVLSFYQLVPPNLPLDPAERLEALRQMTSVSARSVGRVVVSPGHFRRIIAAMQDNLSKFEENHD